MAEHAPEVEVQERGDVFSFYRPKVEQAEAHGLDDVERFHPVHPVLRPEGRCLWRLILLGRKRLPDLDAHARHRGSVDAVAHDADAARAAFGPLGYRTKTRGERHVAAARPAGEGVYALVRDGAGLHLAHRLDPPREPGPVQQALGLEAEAAYASSIKKPEVPGAALLGEGRARLPRTERRLFRGRRYEAESAAPLDHEGVELLLTGEDHLTGEGHDAGEAGAAGPGGVGPATSAAAGSRPRGDGAAAGEGVGVTRSGAERGPRRASATGTSAHIGGLAVRRGAAGAGGLSPSPAGGGGPG